ncbi:MAG: Endoribonuclease [Ramlibacter sp.]|jgi:2-iminobutanoate/2-iminopropanoate deaminase|nr:Endoribonuclease [Ramlibacter sp.]MDB5911670.1 Endoribonuclease [Ramlibacter sp.]
MKEVIDCGLPQLPQPFSWAVKGGGLLFTAHGPVRPDGSIDTGPVAQQARLTFANLQRAVEAAGGSLDDVTQVLIYMTDVADMPAIDAVYREFFRPPWPNRSSAAVAGLVVPGMKLEIVAYAAL